MTRAALLAAVAVVPACARMKPGMGFDDVRADVAARTSMRIHWNTGSEEDRRVEAAVAGLLAGELTADQSVQIALLNNRDLQATYENLHIAQADLVQAGLLHNPVFGGEVRFATDGSGANIALDLVQDFVGLLNMPLRKGRARAAFERAKVGLTAEVLDAAHRTRAAFYEHQAAEQIVRLRRAILDAASASYDLAGRLRAAGNTRDLDFLTEQAIFEQAKLDLAGAEALAAATRERLNALMGLWGEQTRWRTADRLPPLPEAPGDSAGLESRAVEASLDLQLLRRDAEIAARSAGIARPFGWLTSAELGVAAERDFDGDWSVGPSLALPIPLLDQGQAVRGRAGAQYRQAMERLYARAVEVRARARAAHAAMAAAHARARDFENVMLPLRQRIVEETQLHYNAMQVSAFQLLQAKRDQIDAGAQYISALRDFWLARADLDQVLRGRLPPEAAPKRASAASILTGSGAHP